MDDLAQDAGQVPGGDDFFGAVYRELRSVAGGALRRQRLDHTLQPTALVHEAWLKLAKSSTHDREHFLALAVTAMRQVLIDHARARRAGKRGQREAGLDPHTLTTINGDVDIVALDDVLSRLAELNERHARIAELRILGGLTMPEVARVMEIGQRTAELDWKLSRAWLRSELAA